MPGHANFQVRVGDVRTRRLRVPVRGVNPSSIAGLVGNTVEILERHYAPFIPELHDPVRIALERDYGLESIRSEVRDTKREEGKSIQ